MTMEKMAFYNINKNPEFNFERNGFGKAVKKLISETCKKDDDDGLSSDLCRDVASVVPDGFQVLEDQGVLCLEIEDTHPLSVTKMLKYYNIYSALDYIYLGLNVIVTDRYGIDFKTIDEDMLVEFMLLNLDNK